MNTNSIIKKTITFVFLISIFLISCTSPDTDPQKKAESEADFVVTFAGEDCDVSGPKEVPPGEYIIELDDQSETNMVLYVSKLLDGKTFQEWVDEQKTPGVYYPKPDYVEICSKKWVPFEKDSFIYKFDQALVYVFYVYKGSPEPILWKCGFTTVVE